MQKTFLKVIGILFLVVGIAFTSMNCTEEQPGDVDDKSYVRTVVVEPDSVLLDLSDDPVTFRARAYNRHGEELDLPIYWSINRTQSDTFRVASPDASEDGVLEGPEWTFTPINYGEEDIYASTEENPNNTALRDEIAFLVPRGHSNLDPTWDNIVVNLRPRDASGEYNSARFRLEVDNIPPLVDNSSYAYTVYILTDDSNSPISLGALYPNTASQSLSLTKDLERIVDVVVDTIFTETLNFAAEVTGIRFTIEEISTITVDGEEDFPGKPIHYRDGTGIVLFEINLPISENGSVSAIRDLLVYGDSDSSKGEVVLMREGLDTFVATGFAALPNIQEAVEDSNYVVVEALADSLINVSQEYEDEISSVQFTLDNIRYIGDITPIIYDYLGQADVNCYDAIGSLRSIQGRADSIKTISDTLLLGLLARLSSDMNSLNVYVQEAYDNCQQMLTLRINSYDPDFPNPPPDVEIVEMTRDNLTFTVGDVDSIPYIDADINDDWRYVLWFANNNVGSYLPVPKITTTTPGYQDCLLFTFDETTHIETRNTFIESQFGEDLPDYPDQHRLVYITLQNNLLELDFSGIIAAKGMINPN